MLFILFYRNRPCTLGDGTGRACEATFGYKHVFNFSENAQQFEVKIIFMKFSLPHYYSS